MLVELLQVRRTAEVHAEGRQLRCAVPLCEGAVARKQTRGHGFDLRVQLHWPGKRRCAGDHDDARRASGQLQDLPSPESRAVLDHVAFIDDHHPEVALLPQEVPHRRGPRQDPVGGDVKRCCAHGEAQEILAGLDHVDALGPHAGNPPLQLICPHKPHGVGNHDEHWPILSEGAANSDGLDCLAKPHVVAKQDAAAMPHCECHACTLERHQCLV
mmetsp:Transcript_20869/g.53257  ORF Transcript_20869/g.53257 Transcript_20869/m.53257 type:complete len:214 (+) Transcript_20869:1034-1675(+)